MFAADDVVDVERETGIVLMNEAIFADTMGSLNDKPTQAD
jgi:hypothetical protein